MLENLEQDMIQQPQEQEAPQQEVKEVAPVQESQPRESDKEINLRYLRERAEAAERRAYELESAYKQAQSQQQQPQVEDDNFDIDDDDVPVGRQVKKHFGKLRKQIQETQAKLDQLNQKTSIDQAEIKLNTKYKDFNSVVTEDNIRKLAQSDPDAYRNIMKNDDIYDRGYLAYNFIQSKVTNTKTGVSTQEIDRKLEENKNKPRSSANVSPQSGDTPLARAGDYDRRVLTEDDKKRVRSNLAKVRQYR